MANSKRASPRETFQCPYPCGEPRLEALQHQQVVLVQSPTGPLLLSSGSWCVQNFARTLQDCCLCFSQCSGSPIIKSHWPSRSDSKGIPSPFVTRLGSLTWGLDPSQQRENCFGIIVLRSVSHPPGRYGIWFYHDFAPPAISLQLLRLWACGVCFFGVGSNILLLIVVQQLVAILALSQEEMGAHPSTLPSWTGSYVVQIPVPYQIHDLQLHSPTLWLVFLLFWWCPFVR